MLQWALRSRACIRSGVSGQVGRFVARTRHLSPSGAVYQHSPRPIFILNLQRRPCHRCRAVRCRPWIIGRPEALKRLGAHASQKPRSELQRWCPARWYPIARVWWRLIENTPLLYSANGSPTEIQVSGQKDGSTTEIRCVALRCRCVFCSLRWGSVRHPTHFPSQMDTATRLFSLGCAAAPGPGESLPWHTLSSCSLSSRCILLTPQLLTFKCLGTGLHAISLHLSSSA